jgi:hypothetical protein
MFYKRNYFYDIAKNIANLKEDLQFKSTKILHLRLRNRFRNTLSQNEILSF